MNPPDPLLEQHLAQREPPYRSQGEAQIGRLLDRYGIAFFYEQPLLIHDRGRQRTWHPDFTLPGYNNLVVEYAGMPDRDDYMNGIRHEKRAYQANGIEALFLYPRDLQGANWQAKIYQHLQAYRPLSDIQPGQ